jgi:hypothetical protein
MAKLKTLARRLLSSDIRTLVKGGLLDNDLTVTSRGRAAIDALFVEAHMAELVAIAEERIEEDKEECK